MLLGILQRTGQPTQGTVQPQTSIIPSLGIRVYSSTVPYTSVRMEIFYIRTVKRSSCLISHL